MSLPYTHLTSCSSMDGGGRNSGGGHLAAAAAQTNPDHATSSRTEAQMDQARGPGYTGYSSHLSDGHSHGRGHHGGSMRSRSAHSSRTMPHNHHRSGAGNPHKRRPSNSFKSGEDGIIGVETRTALEFCPEETAAQLTLTDQSVFRSGLFFAHLLKTNIKQE